MKGGRAAPPLVCQCPDCDGHVEKGQTFCETHKKGCSIKAVLSGSEPKYAPEEYNNDKAIQHSHNCFAYAMNVKDAKKIAECRQRNNCRFHVPGKTKGHPEFSEQLGKTCGDVIGRTMSDVTKGYMTDFESKCEPNMSKIAVVVDEENDLHYYRQDNNGWWSHKPGGRPVTNKDAVGAYIYNPKRASRYYPAEYEGDSGLNYDSFCSFMCVPRGKDTIKIAGGARKKTRRIKQKKQLKKTRRYK